MYAEGQFIDAYSPTIENTFQKTVKHRDTEYLIEILDTAGQDEYQIFHMRYVTPFPLCFFVTL
jgi:Ras family protein